MVGTVLARLRAATAEAHQRLEARLDLVERIAIPDERRRLVERYHALHVGAEAGMAPLLAGIVGLGYAGRRRTVELASDLAVVGGQPQSGRRIAAPANAAEALGRLYVLEAATQDAKAVARQVTARGQNMRGLSFLDPYGAETGERWRKFVLVLEREAAVSEKAGDDIVRGAVAGFAQAERWLCDTAPALSGAPVAMPA
ncbi:biliverdin-producing heme oxygenase [Phenylobacterium sp. 20VBR1]|uniref:Biliverdin-producing heme oxygenase n=1 Tax=Phenylobacterium glaciei TaxID=2803784 RepID=A0A941CXW6_9CAUL|nr:biliverdin-producing heme oxygenase [Phenylobacterium glaciei]MBR7618357.1 biliverdin-producing heme oxygenase [Phenylobacterium glaciei]